MNGMLEIFLTVFSRLLMLFLVMPVTNTVKGLIAKSLGDSSAEREGRITLNPMAHLDMLGSILIILTGFGWSKPLPVNVNNMKNPNKGIVIMALTSPVTHFIMAIICMNLSSIIMYTASASNAMIAIYYILYFLANINVCLGTLHILPIPPLDGFILLYQLGGVKFRNWYRSHSYIGDYSRYILIGLFLIGSLTRGMIDPLGWLIKIVYGLLECTTFWVPMVFG